jgi:hypothetical protein
MNFGDYRSCGGELLSSHRQALAPVTTRLAPCVRAFLAPTGKCLAQMNNSSDAGKATKGCSALRVRSGNG